VLSQSLFAVPKHFSNRFPFPLGKAHWGKHGQLENTAVQKEATH